MSITNPPRKKLVRFASRDIFIEPRKAASQPGGMTAWRLALSALLLVASVLSWQASSRQLPQFVMSKDERAHVLASFDASAPPAGNSSDTVWARRRYAPMFIHGPRLRAFRTAIERAFPLHAIAFDVVFAAADNAVPWHTDYDSLGPFDVSLRSIVSEDFITVHTNLVTAEDGGGRLRTLNSLPIAAVHYVVNRLTNSFGSLDAITEPLATSLGVQAQTHDATAGVGNAFNNLKAHDVTAGAGRISYVVRLVRKSVVLSGAQIREAASGTRSTRRIREFERLIPLLNGASEVLVGDFPWSSVEKEA